MLANEREEKINTRINMYFALSTKKRLDCEGNKACGSYARSGEALVGKSKYNVHASPL